MESSDRSALEATIPFLLPQLRQIIANTDRHIFPEVAQLELILPTLAAGAQVQAKLNRPRRTEFLTRDDLLDKTKPIDIDPSLPIEKQVELYVRENYRLRKVMFRREHPNKTFKPPRILDEKRHQEEMAGSIQFQIEPRLVANIRLESLSGVTVEQLCNETTVYVQCSTLSFEHY